MTLAIQGSRITGQWGSDEMPKNYREGILFDEPNGRARMTGMMSKMKSESTDNYKFNIFEKTNPTQRTTVASEVAADATTMVVTDYTIFKAGHAVLNERTMETVFVTATPSTTSVAISRAKGYVAQAQVVGAIMNAADGLLIINSHYAENAALSDPISYAPSAVENYVECFETAIAMSELARNTYLRTGNALKELRREANVIHGIEQEKAYFFGSKLDASSASEWNGTTGGLLYWLTSNVTDFSDAVTMDDWEDWLMALFARGSNVKYLYCGNKMLQVLNRMAREYAQLNLEMKAEGWGIKVARWITVFGELIIMNHPMLSENPTFTDWGFAVDPKNLVLRPHKGLDTRFLTDVKKDGGKIQYDCYRTYAGLELQFEAHHGIAKNFSALAA